MLPVRTSLGYIARSRTAGSSYVNLSYTILHSHQPRLGFHLLYLISNICIFCFFDHSHPGRCEVVSHCGLVCISLLSNYIEQFLLGLLAICVFPLEKYLFAFFTTF